MNVEHLWFSSKPLQPQEAHESSRLLDTRLPASANDSSTEEDMVQTLTVMADKRLYKLVKWCKSLPLFKNILVSQENVTLQAKLILVGEAHFPLNKVINPTRSMATHGRWPLNLSKPEPLYEAHFPLNKVITLLLLPFSYSVTGLTFRFICRRSLDP